MNTSKASHSLVTKDKYPIAYRTNINTRKTSSISFKFIFTYHCSFEITLSNYRFNFDERPHIGSLYLILGYAVSNRSPLRQTLWASYLPDPWKRPAKTCVSWSASWNIEIISWVGHSMGWKPSSFLPKKILVYSSLEWKK